MKKILCILLTALIILSLAACSGKTNEDTTEASSKDAAASSEVVSGSTTESTTEATTESTTEATTESTTESTTAPTTAATTAATTKPTTTAPTTEKITTTQKPTEKPTSTTRTPATADLTAVRKKIISTLKISDPMNIDASGIPSLYGIAQKDMASAAGFTTFNGAFPEDVIMIEAADSAAKGRITGILNERLADVKNQSQSYDEENYKLAQSCKVVSSGNYVALFISPSHAEMEKIFLTAVNNSSHAI